MDLKECQADAKRFKTRSDWCQNSFTKWNRARLNGWLDICCEHMIKLREKKGKWDMIGCKKEAERFTTRNSWRVNSRSSYVTASKNGWLDYCCQHIK